MKRKAVLHGPSTLTISLPANWVKKFDVGRGDELTINEVGSELRISTTNGFSTDKKKIDINEHKRLGKSMITSLYRQGYGEVEIIYPDPTYINTIQETLAKEITGFEIIKQSNNTCIIKDLTGHSKDELQNVLKSTWILLLDLSKECLEAMNLKDLTRIKNIPLMDRSINKFSNYCLRILATSSTIDHQKSYLYYHLIKTLENIGDKYKDLSSAFAQTKEKIPGNQSELFLKTNRHLEELFELFYRYNETKTELFFAKTKKTILTLMNQKTQTSQFLLSISTDIRNLISTIIEIHS